jgi:UDP-N-acetylglucosamine/UDP-N-acetylgalactosamine 4-epimerase
MKTYEEQPERIDRLERELGSRPRTWLVTGVAGFIGSHLAERLLRAGQKVVGLDNFSTGKRGNLLHVKNSIPEKAWKNFRFIEGDIRSLETCREACRAVELVLHQAALGSVPRSIDDPLASHDNNVNGFLNMLVAARDAGVARLVYASSSATYGDHPALPKVEPVIGKPMSPYGLTKHVNELYAGVFATCYGFGTIGLRYFNVFGPRQDPNGAYAAVIPAFISSLLLNKTTYINGDGTAARDFCYIDNVVQANLLAATAEDPQAVNQVYNVALGEQTSLLELFDIVKALVAARFPQARAARPVHREPRRGDLKFSQADISKAERLLGYRPACRVVRGLEKAIDWYLADLAAVTAERQVVHA